jgi:hypothetical protein
MIEDSNTHELTNKAKKAPVHHSPVSSISRVFPPFRESLPWRFRSFFGNMTTSISKLSM